MDMKCEGCVNAVKNKLETVNGRLSEAVKRAVYLVVSFSAFFFFFFSPSLFRNSSSLLLYSFKKFFYQELKVLKWT